MVLLTHITKDLFQSYTNDFWNCLRHNSLNNSIKKIIVFSNIKIQNTLNIDKVSFVYRENLTQDVLYDYQRGPVLIKTDPFVKFYSDLKNISVLELTEWMIEGDGYQIFSNNTKKSIIERCHKIKNSELYTQRKKVISPKKSDSKKIEISNDENSIVKLDKTNKKLDVIIISVDYNDYLIITLPKNLEIFENITVITTPEDEMCQKICKKFRVPYITTNVMYESGSKFNKGKTADFAIKMLDDPGYVLLLDADIIINKKIDTSLLKRDVLYTTDRFIIENLDKYKAYLKNREHFLKNQTVNVDERGIGFFQLFHMSSECINPELIYPTDSEDASWTDLKFRDKFSKRENLELEAIHLGPAYTNWSGRNSEKFLPESDLLELLYKKSTYTICSFYFNYRDDHRQKNNFIKFLQQWNGHYHNMVVGLVDYSDLDFEIPCRKITIEGDKGKRIWSKEILINKIAKEIDTDYLIFTDGDIIYENLDWLDNLETVIGDNDFVQLFETINYLGETGEIIETYKSVASGDTDNVDLLLSKGFRPGGSWMTRTKLLKSKPLFEKMIVGGGDTIMAYGIYGQKNGWTLGKVKEGSVEVYDEAKKWILDFGKRKVGYLKTTINHLYHGDLKDRNYNDRYEKLKKLSSTENSNIEINDNEKIDTRPKVCLIYDAEGWIFQSKSNSIKQNLEEFYNFDILKWDKEFDTSKYDIILCYSPACLPRINVPIEKIICGISSHIHQSSNKKLLSFRYNFSNDLKLYNELQSEKKFYAPNGVDTEFFNFKPKTIKDKSIITIAAVGSTGRSIHKGQERLKLITERLNTNKTQVVNKSLFVDAKSDEKLTKEQMREYYKGVDIFVVSSVSEATPNPLLEAMCMYTPCISNNTGMATLLINNGENGYIIEDYDDIDSYVDKIQKIIDNHELYEKFSINSRKSIENYDWKKTMINYKLMFDDFMKDKIEKDITILIKTFNRPNSLFNQIRSIREIYKNIEILVVNDGDEEIDLDRPHLRIINTNFDIGLSAGRNLGIKNIKTKYFILCDDDFEFTPETKIETFWSILEKSDLDIIGGTVNSNGFKMGLFKEYKNQDKNILEIKKGYLEKNNLFYRCDYIRNFFMAKTSTFKEKQIKWDERLKMGEHTLFYYSLWKNKMGVNLGLTEKVSVNNKKEIPTEEYESMRLRSQWFTDHYIKEYGIDTIIINKKIRNQAHEKN